MYFSNGLYYCGNHPYLVSAFKNFPRVARDIYTKTWIVGTRCSGRLVRYMSVLFLPRACALLVFVPADSSVVALTSSFFIPFLCGISHLLTISTPDARSQRIKWATNVHVDAVQCTRHVYFNSCTVIYFHCKHLFQYSTLEWTFVSFAPSMSFEHQEVWTSKVGYILNI